VERLASIRRHVYLLLIPKEVSIAHKNEKSSKAVQDKHFLSFLNFCRLGHVSSPEKATEWAPLINITGATGVRAVLADSGQMVRGKFKCNQAKTSEHQSTGSCFPLLALRPLACYVPVRSADIVLVFVGKSCFICLSASPILDD
jgi:hypothetical protein